MKEPPDDPAPSLPRKAAFYALTFLLVYVVFEVMALMAYVIVGEVSFSFSTLQDRRAQVMTTPGVLEF